MDENNILKPAFQEALSKLTTGNKTKRIHIFPNIAEASIENARSSFGIPTGHHIMVLLDDSLTSSSNRGICVTGKAIYWYHSFEKGKLGLEDINQIEIKPGFLLEIKVNGSDISVNCSSKEEIEPFVDFLKEITSLAIEPSPDKNRHAVEPLPEIRDKRTAEEKEQIADDIVEIGSDEAVAELLDFLKSYSAIKIDIIVAEALAKIGDARFVKPIIESLKSNGGFGSSIRDVSFNETLAWILSSIGEAVTEPLINVLKDDDDERVQMWVIEILGNIRDGRASRPIIEHAISTEIKRQNANRLLRWAYWRTDYHASALALIGEPAVAPLREAMNHENRKIREFAEKVLKKIE